jgi:hypothetical protein
MTRRYDAPADSDAGADWLGRGPATVPLGRDDAPKPRRGWYAYRVAGAATLPSWAVEVALAAERPVELPNEGLPSQDDGTERPWPSAPAGPDGASLAAEGSSAPHPDRPHGQALASEQANPHQSRPVGAEIRAVVLLRAPGRVDWLADFAAVIAEVEAAAGIRSGTGADRSTGNVTEARPHVRTRTRSPVRRRRLPVPRGRLSVPRGRLSIPRGRLSTLRARLPVLPRRLRALVGTRSRLLVGPPLPGLVPIPGATAELHLAAAGARGLPAPLRRRKPAAIGISLAWRAGPGSVLTCDGPCGVSAQAVVDLRGAGNPGAITPPPGGALVLRAWRAKHTWGAACALVLAAGEAPGLGREAGRAAARTRAAGWDAVVLQGEAAMHMARAGDHSVAAPVAAARPVSGTQVATLFEDCLAACGLNRAGSRAGSLSALAETP